MRNLSTKGKTDRDVFTQRPDQRTHRLLINGQCILSQVHKDVSGGQFPNHRSRPTMIELLFWDSEDPHIERFRNLSRLVLRGRINDEDFGVFQTLGTQGNQQPFKML